MACRRREGWPATCKGRPFFVLTPLFDQGKWASWRRLQHSAWAGHVLAGLFLLCSPTPLPTLV
jgi:hypothetical protein